MTDRPQDAIAVAIVVVFEVGLVQGNRRKLDIVFASNLDL